MWDVVDDSVCCTSQLLPRLMQLGRPVALIGMMGAGKTTLARQLSCIMGLVYHDIDHLIEKKLQCSIAEYFAQQGEAAFRKVEAEVIGEYLDRGSAILALGGGAFIQDDLRQQLLDKAWCVYLDVPLDVMWQRVSQRRHSRPMIARENAYRDFSALFAKRSPVYALAPLQLAWRDESIGETAQRVKQGLWQHLRDQV